MKARRLFPVLLAGLLTFSLASCKKDGGDTLSPEKEALASTMQSMEEMSKNGITPENSMYDLTKMFEEYLTEGENSTRFTSVKSFNDALKSDEYTELICSDNLASSLDIATAEAGYKKITVNCPSAKITAKAKMNVVILEAAGEEGCVFEKNVDILIFSGSGIRAELLDGADSVYVKGSNCSLDIKGGSCDKIYIPNFMSSVTNSTEDTITIILQNGSKTLGPGESYPAK